MPYPFALPPRSERLEILDLRPATPQEIDANFTEIARVNRFLGGTKAVRDGLRTLLAALPTDTNPVTILDVAAGGADIPRALIGATRRGDFGADRTLHITATDLSTEVLAHARRQTPTERYPEIAIETADALNLPYADCSFDIATCSMALHHFSPPDAARLLREIARVTRRGFILNDLRRDRVAAALIWVLTRVLGAHPITQHDAPLSVLRAYTPRELQDIFNDASLPGQVAIVCAPMFRVVAVYRAI
jgi:ubiquinone/menaquinone biosynthesis C-methylase UbiE